MRGSECMYVYNEYKYSFPFPGYSPMLRPVPCIISISNSGRALRSALADPSETRDCHGTRHSRVPLRYFRLPVPASPQPTQHGEFEKGLARHCRYSEYLTHPLSAALDAGFLLLLLSRHVPGRLPGQRV